MKRKRLSLLPTFYIAATITNAIFLRFLRPFRQLIPIIFEREQGAEIMKLAERGEGK